MHNIVYRFIYLKGTTELAQPIVHILGLSTTYWPLLGGGETHARALFEGLASRGCEVTLITHRSDATSLSREQLNGVDVIRIENFVKNIGLPNRVAWEDAFFGPLDEISSCLPHKRIDVIHAHNQAALILGAFLKAHLNCKLVATLHETQPERDSLGESRSRIVIGSLPTDHFIVGSQFFEQQALRFGAESHQISRINYGLPPLKLRAEFDKARFRKEYLGLSEEHIVLVAVGRFKPRKRQLDLLRMLQPCMERDPRIHLCLVGSCNSASETYFDQVSTAAMSGSLAGRVTILRDASDTVLAEIVAASDVGIMISEAEGFGLAALEFMSQGIPVVATRVHGLSEFIVDDDNGFLVELHDDESFRAALLKLLESDALRKRLGVRALETARFYSYDSMIDDTLRVYSRLLAGV